MPDPYPPIKDYAIIGDCGSAALVSKNGSIDWLCWPFFHSHSIFGRLLDYEKGGHFQVHPAGAYESEQKYIEDTNILETSFRTETGVLRLTDLMPVAHRHAYDVSLWPDHEILRVVECVEGSVEVEVDFVLRPNYARSLPIISYRGALGYFCAYRGNVFVLRSELPLELSKEKSIIRGRVTLHRGERRFVSLAVDRNEPAVIPILDAYAENKLNLSIEYWKDWASRCNYEGPYRKDVIRSALTLKLLTYPSSGAVVAAPTTSLPEKIGGVRNWDYRYCWVRDAILTLRALFSLGYYAEEQAFFAWLLHTTRTTIPQIDVLYDVFGGRPKRERKLDHLSGYKNSQPVRIGNSAQDQFQLDVYGEIVVAAYEYISRGREIDKWQEGMLKKLGKLVYRKWNEPDNGIWELRCGRVHNTYSKAMAWLALDRLVKLHDDGHVQVPKEDYTRVRDDIREAIETKGFNESLHSYTAWFDGDEMDASLLLLALNGYTGPDEPRMRGTWECIHSRLSRDGYIYRYRYDDGLPRGEGVFGICSFWAVEYLATIGKVGEARKKFEDLLAQSSDLGLFGEEIDVKSGDVLGNYPQAFTHVGLINAAVRIEKAIERKHSQEKSQVQHPGHGT